MQFEFLNAKIVGLKQFLAADKLVRPGQERSGAWIAEPSYEALSGWMIQGRPELQPVEIEVRFEETGWHHVLVRGDVAATAAEQVGLLARFSDEPYYTPLQVEQTELGFKDLYVGAADLTGKRLKICPVRAFSAFGVAEAESPIVTLDCVRVIPMSNAERDEHLRRRSSPATKEVTGMFDSPPSYFPNDQEAASIVYNHARAGFTKIYFRCFAVRCNNYWSKVEEIARIPGSERLNPPMLERYDVLAAAVEAARKEGVELHGVMRMNNVASKHSEGNRSPDTKFRKKHPDKVMLYRDGKPRNLLSYAWPEIRQHKIEIMKEIAGYGVHGIVIDSLRQPQTVLFDQPVVDAYLKETGRDPRTPEESVREEWLRFRADRTFTQLLREMRATLKRMGNFEFTVRTFLDPRQALQCGCDVATWAKEELVDTLIAAPCYMINQPAILDIRAMRAVIGPKVKLIVKTWRMGSMAECENLTAHVYDQGADGVLLYQSDFLIARPYARAQVWNLRHAETTRRLRAEKRSPLT